jgi:hypothetical protein
MQYGAGLWILTPAGEITDYRQAEATNTGRDFRLHKLFFEVRFYYYVPYIPQVVPASRYCTHISVPHQLPSLSRTITKTGKSLVNGTFR